MTLDPDICYRALQSRDRRFDGRFFSGVVTTGIYCRPICPARTPRRENVRYFACAAAAEEAGFRPCLRCRPDVAPGTPAWTGTTATVTRAMRLIEQGLLDEHSLDELSRRLGVGSRHLRRLFVTQLGASPVAVAQTRRAHFARRLIETTRLPMIEIAQGAGYASLRRFNSAIRERFGRTPSELRDRHGRSMPNGHLRLTLAPRAPFDFEGILRFLASRTIAEMDAVEAQTYRRHCRVGDAVGTIEIDANEREVALATSDTLVRDLRFVVERVRRMLDLDADSEAIGSHLGRDRLLKRLLRRRPGVRIAGSWDPFEVCVRAVVGQQVSVAAASTIMRRIIERFGDRLPTAEGEERLLFPSPETLASVPLEGLGMPRRRCETIREIARAVASRGIVLDGSTTLDTTVASLTSLSGIGNWTAEYIALRALSEPDAFPAGDLGLRKAAGEGGPPLSERELLRRAESWRPWRGYAAMLLWGSLS